MRYLRVYILQVMGVRHVLLTKYVQVTELEAQDPGAGQRRVEKINFFKA